MARYGRKRQFSRGGSKYSKRGGARRGGSTFGRIKRVERKLKGFGRSIETKFKDYQSNSTTVTAATAPWIRGVLDDISQGNLNDNRTGNKIRLKRLWFGLQMTASTSSPNFWQDDVRIMLVKDSKNSTDVAPSLADVIDTSKIQDDMLVLAPLNWSNRHRFKVIYDKRITLQAPFMDWEPVAAPPGTTRSGVATKYPHMYNKKKSIKLNFDVEWDADGTATTPHTDTGLYFFIYSNTYVGAKPIFRLQYRIQYTDL